MLRNNHYQTDKDLGLSCKSKGKFLLDFHYMEVCYVTAWYNWPGAIARSVAMSLGNQTAPRSILVSGTSFHEDFVTKLFLRPFFLFRWFKKSSFQLMMKGCALSTGYRSRGGLPRNSVDRITDCPDMTSAVDRGRKASTQTNKHGTIKISCVFSTVSKREQLLLCSFNIESSIKNNGSDFHWSSLLLDQLLYWYCHKVGQTEFDIAHVQIFVWFWWKEHYFELAWMAYICLRVLWHQTCMLAWPNRFLSE